MFKKLILGMALCAFATSAYMTVSTAKAEDTPMSKTEKVKKMKKHFQEIDLDGDGEINKAEFLAMSEKRFEKMDKDGNGSLSKAEMREMRKHFKGKKPMEE